MALMRSPVVPLILASLLLAVTGCAGSHRDVTATPATELPRPDAQPAGVTPRFDWPLRNGRILSGYGSQRRTHRHTGLDIGGEHGEPILAAQAGRVIYSGSGLRGYGKTIIIDHENDLQTLYAHNSALLVDAGKWVARGQIIARVGRTGNASADHCHFEIRRNDVAVDPLPYLQARAGIQP